MQPVGFGTWDRKACGACSRLQDAASCLSLSARITQTPLGPRVLETCCARTFPPDVLKLRCTTIDLEKTLCRHYARTVRNTVGYTGLMVFEA